MAKYENLLKPVRIGKNVVLKNRLLSSNGLPHFLQGPENWPNDPIMLYQAQIAKNAAIVTIGNWTNLKQRESRGDGAHFPMFNIKDPAVENSLALYCEVIHMYGAKATIAVNAVAPAGYGVCDSEGGGGMMMGPPPGGPGEEDDDIAPGGGMMGPPMDEDMSEEDKKKMMEEMMAMMGGGKKKAVTPEIMQDIIKQVVKDCKYWKDIGFDGASFHMAYQGPLCAQFLSPLCNKRTDEYGGSIENRARFPLAICEAVKKELGEDFIIEVLMSGKEAPGGITIEDTVAFAKLAEGKVDILQIRGGDGDEAHPTTFNSTKIPVTLEVSEAVKKSGAKILTAPIGGLQDPDLAEQWIAEGKMDMMAAARAYIADHDYTKKLTEGRGDDVVPCIRCNKCHGASMTGPWISFCSVNPTIGVDHMTERLFKPADKVKKVAVIGGGPAGMNAAINLIDRGHKVVLFEREAVLGGQLIHADYATFKWTIKDFKDWLVYQCGKKGVDVRLGKTPTVDEIKAEGFDTVIVANGAEPNIPDIPGLVNPDGSLAANVFTPISVFGNVDKLGKKVAVVGGSEIGCETGMYIAENDRDVTVLTRKNTLAPSAQRVHYNLPAVGYHGLKRKTGCTTIGFADGKLSDVNHKGIEKSIEVDSVVISGGLNPRQEEALAYYGAAPEFYICGDAAGDGEGNIAKVMRSSWSIASMV